MIVQLTDDLRVAVDRLNHTLEERRVAGPEAKEPGAESWHAVGYYDRMGSALRMAAHLTVLDSEEERMSIADWAEAMRETTERFAAMVADI